MAATGVVSNICATSPCIDNKIGLHPSLNFFLSDCGKSLVLTNLRGRTGASTISSLSLRILKSGNPVIQCRHARSKSHDGRSNPSGTSICFPVLLLLKVQNPSAPDKILIFLFVTILVFMNSWRVSATWATSSFISVSISGMVGGSATASGIVSSATTSASSSLLAASASPSSLESSCRIAILFVSNVDFICSTDRLNVLNADPIVLRILTKSVFWVCIL
mmetsp:Transcript_41853/g.75409  ORF Transcript_41853/g.75409 Transcript_41853/m.75409 type:complete len:220 (-) Transcript_41853:663-1322(-)